jgi:hypothetical protein
LVTSGLDFPSACAQAFRDKLLPGLHLSPSLPTSHRRKADVSLRESVGIASSLVNSPLLWTPSPRVGKGRVQGLKVPAVPLMPPDPVLRLVGQDGSSVIDMTPETRLRYRSLIEVLHSFDRSSTAPTIDCSGARVLTQRHRACETAAVRSCLVGPSRCVTRSLDGAGPDGWSDRRDGSSS